MDALIQNGHSAYPLVDYLDILSDSGCFRDDASLDWINNDFPKATADPGANSRVWSFLEDNDFIRQVVVLESD